MEMESMNTEIQRAKCSGVGTRGDGGGGGKEGEGGENFKKI
jgi:hypothetical protein